VIVAECGIRSSRDNDLPSKRWHPSSPRCNAGISHKAGRVGRSHQSVNLACTCRRAVVGEVRGGGRQRRKSWWSLFERDRQTAWENASGCGDAGLPGRSDPPRILGTDPKPLTKTYYHEYSKITQLGQLHDCGTSNGLWPHVTISNQILVLDFSPLLQHVQLNNVGLDMWE